MKIISETLYIYCMQRLFDIAFYFLHYLCVCIINVNINSNHNEKGNGDSKVTKKTSNLCNKHFPIKEQVNGRFLIFQKH